MAAGDLKGTLAGSGTSIPAGGNMASSGSVAVSIGDLIVAEVAELVANTVTSVNDNLGHTLTAQNAGTLSTVAGRMFWIIATVAGTLTAVTGHGTASNDDFSVTASVFEGMFTVSPLDQSPANATDATSPFTCTATGTLAQASELVVVGLALTRGQTDTAATSPNLLAVNQASGADNAANSVCSAIGYQTVSATTSISPAFTATGTFNGAVEHTMTFKLAANTAKSVTVAQTSEVIRRASQINHAVSFASAEVLSLLRGVGKMFSWASAGVVSLATAGGANQVSASVASAESVSLQRAVGTAINAASALIVGVQLAVGKTLGAVSASAASLTGLVGVSASLSGAQIVGIVLGVGKLVSSASAEVFNAVLFVGKLLGLGIAASTAMSAVAIANRTLGVVSSSSLAVARDVGKSVGVSSAVLVSTVSAIVHQVSLVTAQIASLVPLRAAIQYSVDVFQAQSTSLMRSGDKLLGIATGSVVFLPRAVAVFIVAAMFGVASLLKDAGKSISVTIGQIAFLDMLKFFGMMVNSLLSAVSSLNKGIGKGLALRSVVSIVVIRYVTVIISMSQSTVVTFIASLSLVISTVSGQVVSLAKDRGRFIVVSLNSTMTLGRNIFQTIASLIHPIFAVIISFNFVNSNVVSASYIILARSKLALVGLFGGSSLSLLRNSWRRAITLLRLLGDVMSSSTITGDKIATPGASDDRVV